MATDSAQAVTSAEVTAYHRDGFLVVRGVFAPEELAALEVEARALMERKDLMESDNIRCRWQKIVGTEECIFDCFDPVIDLGPVSKRFAYDARIANVLRALYDDEPRLFKDKLIFKRPGATGYSLHQDYIAWDDFPETFLTVLVPIDASSLENGATEVYAGLHRDGYLSPRDGMYHDLPVEKLQGKAPIALELAPGDIAVFSGYTPHKSGANLSNGWRRQLYLSYNADRDGGDRREQHYRSFHKWLKERYAEYGRNDVFFK